MLGPSVDTAVLLPKLPISMETPAHSRLQNQSLRLRILALGLFRLWDPRDIYPSSLRWFTSRKQVGAWDIGLWASGLKFRRYRLSHQYDDNPDSRKPTTQRSIIKSSTLNPR